MSKGYAMNALEAKRMIIQLQQEKINDLEAELNELKYKASMAQKNNKQEKRKPVKVEKMGRLILFPARKKLPNN